jgi:rhodanese-related sulfurtransferase
MSNVKFNKRAMVLVALIAAFMLAFIPQPGPRITEMTDPTSLAEEIVNKEAMIHPDHLARWVIDKKADLQIIDVRSAEDHKKYAIPSSENIPVKQLLESTYDLRTDMDIVLASNGDNQASQVWLVLRMMGFENVYVLQGGVNYWVENIVNPTEPSPNSPDSEIFKYEFRKAAGQFLGGGAAIASSTQESDIKKKFVPKKRKKKKKARAGCSG